MKILDHIRELFFPTNLKCIVCNDEIFTDNDFCLCKNCLKDIPFLVDHFCEVCGRKVFGEGKLCNYCVKEKIDLKLARAPILYNKTMHNLVTGLKYHNQRYLAKPLGNLLYNFFVHSSEFDNIDIIVPVPIYKTRLKARGYNQVELLLQSFMKTQKVDFGVLEKVRDTGSQTDKNYQERLTSLDNAFRVIDESKVKNKVVLVVDDIYTTGATCNSVCKTLLKAGAKEVKALTLCNVVYKLNEKNQNQIDVEALNKKDKV